MMDKILIFLSCCGHMFRSVPKNITCIAIFYVFKVIYAKKIEGNETPKAGETEFSLKCSLCFESFNYGVSPGPVAGGF